MSVSDLRVRLFGGLEVEGLTQSAVGSRKARLLLAALACEPDAPQPVDRLVEAVWGDEPPDRAHEQLGVLVSRLRSVLGAERIERSDAGLRLHPDWLDLTELMALADRAHEQQQADDALGARLAATMALDLVRGPLLPEHDAEWVSGPRRAAERRIGELRVLVAAAALRTGDAFGSATAASAALEHDPYDETALRVLMRAHVAAGRPASALAAYATVRERLVADLGVGPSAETEALHDEIVLAPDEPPAASGAPVVERTHPLVQRARTELALMDFEAAERDAEAAVERDGGASALEIAGWVAYYRRDFATALAHAEAGAAAALVEERRASCLTLAGRVLHSEGELQAAERRLSEAARCRVPGVRGAAEVWLGALRNHQGRPREALALLSPGPSDEATIRHPFVLPQALFGRVYALGQIGELATAFLVLQEWKGSLDDLGPAGERYRPAFHNFSAWLLGAVGVLGDARTHSERALSLAHDGGEPANHARLDLAQAALDAGDLDRARRWLDEITFAEEVDSTMEWHQRHRLDLCLGRLAMLEGYPSLALDLTERVAAGAREVGAVRTAWQADVEAELVAAGTVGGSVSHERIDRALAGLDDVAGLEAWRASARLGAATGRADLWDAAEARADVLAERSGDWAEMVRGYTSAVIGKLRG